MRYPTTVCPYVVTVFVGPWGPPKRPNDFARGARRALHAALSDPAMSVLIVRNGGMVGGGGPERLDALTRENFKLRGEVARPNNIKAL